MKVERHGVVTYDFTGMTEWQYNVIQRALTRMMSHQTWTPAPGDQKAAREILETMEAQGGATPNPSRADYRQFTENALKQGPNDFPEVEPHEFVPADVDSPSTKCFHMVPGLRPGIFSALRCQRERDHKVHGIGRYEKHPFQSVQGGTVETCVQILGTGEICRLSEEHMIHSRAASEPGA